ncbi:MAG: putative porin [Rikenellaceae bacterium]
MRAQVLFDDEDGNSIYGSNPYENEDEAGLPPREKGQDSMKVVIRKPLESYFFDDSVRARKNFVWNVDRDFNRVAVSSIDTLLNDWRIDYPFQKDGVGDMYLGGLGQATQAINYYDREQYYDFIFAQPYDAYIFRQENAPFYNVKKPMTIFSYLESGQTNYRESNFGIMHAQNIAPSTGFAIDYKARSTKGLYQRQDTKNHNLAVTFSHTGRRYSLHAGYLNNSIDTEESGGVVGLWTVRDSVFEKNIGIPVKLMNADAENKYRNNSVFLVQSYGIPLQPLTEEDYTMANHTAFYIGHSLEYNNWNKVYSDVKGSYTNDRAGINEDGTYYSEELYYYDNWYINPTQTRDSINERVISNRVFIQAQPWDRNAIVGTLDGGIGFDVRSYSQLGLDSYLSGEYNRETRSTWFVYGAIEGKFRRYFKWGGEVKIHPSGYRAGDYSIKGDIEMSAYLRDKPITLTANFESKRESPSYWQENLFSNHFVFLTPLADKSDTRIDAQLKVPSWNLEIGASMTATDNLVYYDTDCNLVQEDALVTTSQIYLRKKFQLGGLHLDHRILGQWSTDQAAVPLPDFSAYLSYYYEFDVVKSVLRMQIGVDGRYTTSYYMPDYNPALSSFFNQQEYQIGGYPYMDAFVSAKWKRMRILVKYQHVNQGLFGNNEYFTVANYPLNPGMFKFGISWGFYD